MTDASEGRRILVTGPTGLVGRHVVEALAARGLKPVAGLRNPARPRPPLDDSVERVAFDFAAPASWPEALQGIDGVFLLRPPPIADVQGVIAPFIDAALAAGAEQIVFLSVAGAERIRFIPHAKVEAHLMRSPARWTFLRAGFFSQNCEGAYARDLRQDDRLFVPAGTGRVAFVDTRDLGAVAAAAFADPEAHLRKAWHLTGPQAVPFTELAGLLSDALGRPIRYEPASVPGYLRHLRRGGLPWAQAVVQTVLHWQLRGGGAEAVTDTLAELLGRPPLTLARYVTDHAHLWRI